MEMFPCKSSLISAYGYDDKRMEMDIEFNDGAVFRYFRVPKEVIVELVRSKSKGQYFLASIKHNYDYAPRFSNAQTDEEVADGD